tara:strand:+ start:12951 stop:14237 length:1287 start_codon:yes stop_codon:yes gene_type:complete
MGHMSITERVLLVSTTTGYQIQAFKQEAAKLNVELILATDRCHVLEDPWRDRAVPIRFSDDAETVRVIRDAANRKPIVGIVAIGDKSARVAAVIAESLGLSGHPISAVDICGNKFLTRLRLKEAGLLVPWFKRFSFEDSALELLKSDIDFPCVMKPLSLSASQGVMRIDSSAELEIGLQRINELLEISGESGAGLSSKREIILEGYIPGREVAVEGLMTQGELNILAVFDKPDPLEGPYFEETIYVTSNEAGGLERKRLCEVVCESVRALGLLNGPIHAECRINKNGIFVLEVAARPIGGLCSRMLRFDCEGRQSLSHESLILNHAAGRSVATYKRESCVSAVMMIPITRDGHLKNMEGVELAKNVEFIEDVIITAKLGQHLRPPPDGGSYLGFIFSRGNSQKKVIRALRTAHALLSFEVVTHLEVKS